MAQFPAVIDLSSLDGSNGFRLDGIDAYDDSGIDVSAGGDVNGDGFDDILIGVRADPVGDSDAGESYVVFGKFAGFAAALDLSSLNGTNGFRLDGIDAGDYSGVSVSSAGDVNGDGFDDILIGAYGGDAGGDSDAGESYVVFGKASGFTAALDLSSLNGSNGFRLDGTDAGDGSGYAVSAAGDVNGDGFEDILIGTQFADPHGASYAGETYVVFGKASGFTVALDLSSLNGTNGFRLDGTDAGDGSGDAVSSAGDVNGDGFDDILIGAPRADPGGDSYAGESYVVFGKASGFTAAIDLSSLNGSNGFRLDGIDVLDSSGLSLSAAGDVNGDGFDDILIGAHRGDPDGYRDAGETYVVFGKASGFAVALDLSSLNGTNGFRLDGIDVYDFSGYAVSSAGDVNGDGFDDILIGAPGGDQGDSDAGESYVVFGKASGFTAAIDLSSLNGSNGFRLDGIDAGDYSGHSVSAAGDVNGDGFDDILIGAPGGNPGGDTEAGESYVVFGHASTGARDDSFSIAEDGSVAGSVFADNGHGLDTDETGGALKVTSVNGLAANVGEQIALTSGALVRVNANGTLAYKPNHAFDNLPDAGSGAAITSATDSLTYTLTGGSTATVTVTIAGIDSDDVLSGTSDIDTLQAGIGDDQVSGLAGSDILDGGAGADTLEGGAGGDALAGGAGLDAASYEHATARVRANLADAASNIRGAAGDSYVSIENIVGSGFGDGLFGDDGSNRLTGLNGADRLRGRAGDDKLEGGVGADALGGGDGADTLDGGAGDDRLFGFWGIDTFRGGLGLDTFRLSAAGQDIVQDFVSVDDTLEVAASRFGGGLVAGAPLDPAQFVSSTTGLAGDDDDRFIYNTATGGLFFDRNGSTPGGERPIAAFVGAPLLTAGDFDIV